jgi:nucleotide-binding universal stress UspA family protein
MSRRVLLCFDGSPQAAAAIRRAGTLMPAAETEATVLVVWTPAADILPLNPVGAVVGRVSGLYADWDEIASERADRDVQAGCAIAAGAGFRARPLVCAGKAAETILRVAAESEVDLVVLGADGASDARGVVGLLGSVSARVAHGSVRPVLIVPGPDA